MAALLKNVTNCVWQAFNSLDTDNTGTVVKSKLKVSHAIYTFVYRLRDAWLMFGRRICSTVDVVRTFGSFEGKILDIMIIVRVILHIPLEICILVLPICPKNIIQCHLTVTFCDTHCIFPFRIFDHNSRFDAYVPYNQSSTRAFGY